MYNIASILRKFDTVGEEIMRMGDSHVRVTIADLERSMLAVLPRIVSYTNESWALWNGARS